MCIRAELCPITGVPHLGQKYWISVLPLAAGV